MGSVAPAKDRRVLEVKSRVGVKDVYEGCGYLQGMSGGQVKVKEKVAQARNTRKEKWCFDGLLRNTDEGKRGRKLCVPKE